MDRFLLMHSFARVVETGSFSAVAREMGTGQPNISRHIAALERHLGTRLLHRSTRKLTLTPEGERYYSQTRNVIDAITEAESTARGNDAPRGLLRVACPTVLGRSHILPQVKTILARFPEMEIDYRLAIATSISSRRELISLSASGPSKTVRSRHGALALPSDSASRAASISLHIRHRQVRRIYRTIIVSSTRCPRPAVPGHSGTSTWMFVGAFE